MLDVSQITNHVPAEMRSMINDLRRVHTSAAVIQVQMREGTYNTLDFFDERFPPNRANAQSIASLRYEGGSYIIRSQRIQNKKFRAGNVYGAFRERVTKDARKMQKMLREYIYPFHIYEIIDMTENTRTSFANWVNAPERDMCTITGSLPSIIKRDLIEEMLHLRMQGTQFKTERFRKIANEALPLYDEYARRSSLKVTHMHVYVQPDGKVVVTKATEDRSFDWQTTTYDGMDKVPENIQQQISMLKLVDIAQYVPEVGQRMAEDIYWIHVIAAS